MKALKLSGPLLLVIGIALLKFLGLILLAVGGTVGGIFAIVVIPPLALVLLYEFGSFLAAIPATGVIIILLCMILMNLNQRSSA